MGAPPSGRTSEWWHLRLLLRPSRRANDLIIGVIGRAQRKYGMKIPALHLGALSAAAALIAATTLTACLIPAWRAARVSPRDALSDG